MLGLELKCRCLSSRTDPVANFGGYLPLGVVFAYFDGVLAGTGTTIQD